MCLHVCLSSGRAVWKSSHLLDDCLMGAVVFTQQDPAGVLGWVMLVQAVQQRHVQIPLPRKLTVHKRTELEDRNAQSHSQMPYLRHTNQWPLGSLTSSQSWFSFLDYFLNLFVTFGIIFGISTWLASTDKRLFVWSWAMMHLKWPYISKQCYF